MSARSGSSGCADSLALRETDSSDQMHVRWFETRSASLTVTMIVNRDPEPCLMFTLTPARSGGSVNAGVLDMVTWLMLVSEGS